MTHPLHSAIRAQLLAVAEELSLPITIADVAALTDAAVGAALATPTPDGSIKLSNQQTGMLVALAMGESTDATARRMCLSPWTVKTHRRKAYAKLGATTGAQAVATAMSLGLLRPGQVNPLPMPGQHDRRSV